MAQIYDAYTECLMERIGYLDALRDVGNILSACKVNAPKELIDALEGIEEAIEEKNAAHRIAHERTKKEAIAERNLNAAKGV